MRLRVPHESKIKFIQAPTPDHSVRCSLLIYGLYAHLPIIIRACTNVVRPFCLCTPRLTGELTADLVLSLKNLGILHPVMLSSRHDEHRFIYN